VFEWLCISVILVHAGVTIVLTDWEVAHLGEEKPDFHTELEWAFVSFYTMELFLKFSVHRIHFFCNEDARWNIFDLVLVTIGLADLVLLGQGTGSGMNLSVMRSLRVVKMAKMLRMLRVMNFFRDLRLLLNSMLGSFSSFFWCVLMLIFLLNLFGLVFVQGVVTHLGNTIQGSPSPEQEELLEQFSSVMDTMLVLFMATMGGSDWGEVYHLLSVIGGAYALLFIFYISFFHFSIFNVLTGIFVEKAMKLAQPDRETMIVERRKQEVLEAQELWELFDAMDTNDSGLINLEEFRDFVMHPTFRRYLGLLDIDVKDAQRFYEMLAHINGSADAQVDIGSLVEGCMRLKGQATSIDLHTLMWEMRGLSRFTCDSFGDLQTRVKALESRLRRPPLDELYQRVCDGRDNVRLEGSPVTRPSPFPTATTSRGTCL